MAHHSSVENMGKQLSKPHHSSLFSSPRTSFWYIVLDMPPGLQRSSTSFVHSSIQSLVPQGPLPPARNATPVRAPEPPRRLHHLVDVHAGPQAARHRRRRVPHVDVPAIIPLRLRGVPGVLSLVAAVAAAA